MSQWIKSKALPKCIPINLERIYAVTFQELTPAALEQRSKSTNPWFHIYFFPGCSMTEEECEVSWSFKDYNQALLCYLKLTELLDVDTL